MNVRMNLSSKIGQMIMLGFEGTAPTDDLRRFLRDYPFGGIILFSRNYSDKEQVTELCARLQEWNRADHPEAPPLFIGVDQEGGRVKRLGPPFTQSPPNRTWGEQDFPERTRENARIVGRELKEAGININFAPVLDVDTNPNNPIIGDRAYGPDPCLVSRHGRAAIQGFRKGGVFPVGKHFPGHGDTSLDSHLDLPAVDTTLEHLKKVELTPFAMSIAEGLEMIMTAHVLYKNIDPLKPATFSRRILSDILRGEMGFDGVVFSDDMEMGAVGCHCPFPEACCMAVDAGVDILLVCKDREKQTAAFHALVNAVEEGKIGEARVEESVERILRLKNKIPA